MKIDVVLQVLLLSHGVCFTVVKLRGGLLEQLIDLFGCSLAYQTPPAQASDQISCRAAERDS